MKIENNFTFNKVRYDKENELHLVISLKAPKKDWEKERPPVCIIPVIDCSGSMGGQKLNFARKSAFKLAEHLTDQDYAGLASFANDAQVDAEVRPMDFGNKESLNAKIRDLHTRGCTNFSGGMLLALEQINNADLPKDIMKRVIMLTDGIANMGVATDSESLMRLFEEKCGDVTLSCFGYGEDADQELLTNLSDKSKGNYAFIQNPSDALGAFAKELGGLLSTYARNVEIEVLPKHNHGLVEVVSDVDVDGDKTRATITLPEIMGEEERHVVVKVKLSKQSDVVSSACFDIRVSYDLVTKDGELERQSSKFTAKMHFVKEGEEQEKPDKDLDQIVATAEMVQAQIKAEKEAKSGNFTKAQQMLQKFGKNLSVRGLADQASLADKLSEKFCSADVYNYSASYLSGTKSRMKRAYGVSSVSADVMKDTDYIGFASNEAQQSLTSDFTGEETEQADLTEGSGYEAISKSSSKRW